jgi:hypothetical protein
VHARVRQSGGGTQPPASLSLVMVALRPLAGQAGPSRPVLCNARSVPARAALMPLSPPHGQDSETGDGAGPRGDN